MSNRPLVLVVEDEPDLRDTVARILHHEGYQVVTAASCAGAHNALAATPPGLLIADMRLPDGDGLDLVRAARTAIPAIPAVVVSAYLTRESHHAARAAGAVAILSKPFTVNAFAKAVEQARQLN